MTRIALLGAGRWGPNLLRNFRAIPKTEVVAIVDPDRSRLTAFETEPAGPRLEETPDAVLSDPSIDAVVVATPTMTHYPLVKTALLAGKHVMVEKPITKSAAEARELEALAQEKRRVLFVGHIFLFNPAIQRVKSLIEDGTLGQLCSLSMRRTNLGPVRMDIHAGWDLASHDLSIANWWLGDAPTSVSAVGQSWINSGVPDSVFACFRYPGDILCHINVSWLHPRKDRVISVVGTEQMLEVDDLNTTTPVALFDKRVSEETTRVPFVDGEFRITTVDRGAKAVKVDAGEPMRAECEEFLSCIREGRPSVSDGAFGRQVVSALEAMDRSMASGGTPVSIEGK